MTANELVSEVIPSPVAGFGGNFVYATPSKVRALPQYIDDLTFGLRSDIYEQMMLDSQVKSCLGIFIDAILAKGYNISPYSKKGEQAVESDREVASFISENLETLETCLLTNVLPDMLTACAVGNRVGELKFWATTDIENPFPGKLSLRAIKVKQKNSIAFVVNEFLDILGIAGVRLPYITQEVGPNNVFDKEKFVWLTWEPRDNDPRGTSVLRSSYDPWWFKQQLKPEHMKFLTQFASCSIIGKTAPNARKIPALEADGQPILDALGNQVMIDPANLMITVLERLRNGAVGVFPAGSEVDRLEANGTGEAFILAKEMFDHDIAKSILYSTGATERNDGGGRSTAVIHQDSFLIRVAKGKKYVKDLLQCIVDRLVKYNYPKGTQSPLVNVSSTEDIDFLSKSSAISKLAQVGVIDPSQLEALDVFLGLPDRSPESIAEFIKNYTPQFNPSGAGGPFSPLTNANPKG